MEHDVKPVARSRAVKILVTGAYGTGKTTLVLELVDAMTREGLRVAHVDEIPRRCPYALNQDQTPLASAWLIGEQIRCEVEAATVDVDVVICDRGLPDFISHTTLLRPAEDRERLMIASLVEVARAWSRTYELAFWATIDRNRRIQADGMRIDDPRYQAYLQEEIARAYEKLSIPVHELPRELGDRTIFVMRAIRDILPHGP